MPNLDLSLGLSPVPDTHSSYQNRKVTVSLYSSVPVFQMGVKAVFSSWIYKKFKLNTLVLGGKRRLACFKLLHIFKK